MPWFKVDDTLHGHPKTRRAGLAAMGMWVLAGSYSMSYVTEGFVAEWWVNSFPQGRKRAGELVAAGFWQTGERDGERGWVFHDWPDYQPSKAEIEADREASRERQRKFRAKRREERRNAVTNTVTDGVSHGTPSRPVPTRPDPARSSVVLSVVGDGSPSPNRHLGDEPEPATDWA